MNPEAQIWKDRYFALKKWVEDNIPPESKESKKVAHYDAHALVNLDPNVSIGTTDDWSDFWESREK